MRQLYQLVEFDLTNCIFYSKNTIKDALKDKRQLFFLGSLALLFLLGTFLLSETVRLASQRQDLRRFAQERGVQRLPIQANDRARGLIFDGLEEDFDGACNGLLRLRTNTPAGDKLETLCTHGPDPAPEGVDLQQDTPPLTKALPFSHKNVLGLACDGDGSAGSRVQVVYARSSDVPDRFLTYYSSFQTWAKAMDDILLNSATKTGGSRRVRFVHDSSCSALGSPLISNVVMSPTGDDTFSNTVSELKVQGYNRADRKYLIFVDKKVYCGVATIFKDDKPGTDNVNNKGPSYARVDSSCWGGSLPAHEFMHNIGGVQLSAPHTSGGYHCTDEYDRMCYSDPPNHPAMTYVCSSSNDSLYDCNNDDYFHTNPPDGKYLDTHWNTANSYYLIGGQNPTPTSPATPTITNIPTPTIKPISAPTATPTPVPTDTTPPVVQITYPLDGSVLNRKSNITISAVASDNVAVSRVEFLINNSLLCTDSSVSYDCGWTVPGKPNTTYTVTARAYDTAGLQASQSINVSAK